MRNKLKVEVGFTLIELIIYMTIASILILAIMTNLNNANKSYRKTDLTINQIRNARSSLETIVDELRYAKDIKISIDNTEIRSYKYGDETLTRRIYVANDTNGNKILYRTIGANPAVALTKIPLQSFSCSFNASDTTNKTIDLLIKLSNQVELTTTVYTINASTTNIYE
jgi:type II secretory pathway pseudopilin PulG